MPYIPSQQADTGSFVQLTPIFDIARITEVEVGSPEFQQLFVQLYQQVNNISTVLNTKESGFYVNQEFLTGAFLFNPLSQDFNRQRPIYRLELDTGPLPAGVKNIPHGLTMTATFEMVFIQGAASDNIGFNYYPLPFASAGGATNIDVRVNNVNVVITNNSGVAFTSGKVMLEYVKY